jgi:hypothetical protein
MRILLIPPLGDTPWASQRAVVDALVAQRHDVETADVAGGNFPQPAAYEPIPRHPEPTWRFVRARARAYVAFLRAVRPRATRVAYVSPEQRPTRRRYTVERLVASFAADTLVVPSARTTLANYGRQAIAAPIDESQIDESVEPIAGGWVVFARAQPSLTAMELLDIEARRMPAAAVVVDGRSADGSVGADDLYIKAVSGAPCLDFAIDDGWISRHRPSFVVDPVGVLVRVDHRHRAAFRAGIAVRLPPACNIDPVIDQVAALPRGDWLEIHPLHTGARGLEAWVRDAVHDPTSPRWEFVARNGKPVLQCPSCASEQRTTQATVQRVTTIFRCGACGLRYGSPKVPDELVYDAGYHDGSGLFGADYAASPWFFDGVSDDRLDYLQHVGFSPSAGPLLDVGTGLGHFVRRARHRGWDADGLEISEDAVAYAQREIGIDLIVGGIDDFVPERRYAVATLAQTLEHFERPGDVLDRIRENVLEPRGALYVEVPHVNGLARRLRRSNWAHWQSGDHVSFFERRQLADLMQRHGFDVVTFDTFSFPAPGAIGALQTMGVFDATTPFGSAVRVATRAARLKLPFLHDPSGPVTGAEEIPQSRTGLAIGAAADVLYRAGLGDHIRLVARAR